jgi:hypothetical protein
MEKEEFLLCQCHSAEHQLFFTWWDDEDIKEVFMHVHLAKHTFWERLVYGIKYIFGYQCKYGAFDEMILRKEDAEKLQNVVDYLKRTN